jgi:hypothetical protein
VSAGGAWLNLQSDAFGSFLHATGIRAAVVAHLRRKISAVIPPEQVPPGGAKIRKICIAFPPETGADFAPSTD